MAKSNQAVVTVASGPQAAATAQAASRINSGWYVVLVLLILGFITASVVLQKGGWLFGEADMFLVDHNDPGRPFLSKILAPHSHDASHYQARELSHVFENFDARFIRWSTDHKFPHFYSIITFLFLAIISLGHFYYATKYFRMDPVIVILLIALFWTAPCIFFSGIYMRVAKAGAALFLFFLAWNLIRNTGWVNAARKFLNPSTTAFKVILWFTTFLLTLGMCWMDRQGYFIAGCFVLTLLAFGLGPKIPFRPLLITSMVAGLLVHTFYGKYIGPELIQKHTGFHVSFQYQKLPWEQFFKDFFKFIWQGIVLLLNNFRWFFGNVTGGLTLFVWAAICWMLGKYRIRSVEAQPTIGVKSLFAVLFVGWIGLLVVMNALMALRHEPLIWPDHRTFYYWIPTTVLVLLGITFALYIALQRFAIPIWLTRAALLALVISNISALPEHNRIVRTGHLQGYIAAAPHLLNAMKELGNTPIAATPVKKFDAAKLAGIEGDFNAILKNPLANPNMTVQDFVFSSHFYNYLRSVRNLEYRGP